MRLLFLNYEFPPIGGGGANANAYLFRHFAAIPDLTIDCITSTMAERDETVAWSERITLHRLAVGKKALHYWTQREVLTWLWRADALARRLVEAQRYDLCHAFFGFPSGAIAWRLRHKLPYLVSLRGSDVPGFNPRFAAQYVLLAPLFHRIWRQAEAVVANSAGLARLAQRFDPLVPLAVVPNGIDIAEFTPARELSVQAEIVCVSRLVERKGVQHLIEALPAIAARIPEVRLTVIGEGNLAETLTRRISELELNERVTLRGYVPHDDLAQHYRRAQLFVLPSYYEGMSNTMLEAMACGLPVVASGEGGREELLGANAAFVPYGEVGALAQVVAELLASPQRCRAMGGESRRIAERFSWSAVAEQYLADYRRISEGRRCAE